MQNSLSTGKQFYEKSLALLEQILSPATERQAASEYESQVAHLYELVEKIPGRTEDVSLGDLSNIYFFARLCRPAKNVGTNPKRDELRRHQIETLKRQLHKIAVGEREVFNFYFPVRRLVNFVPGFQIGTGNLFAFNELSKTTQRVISLAPMRNRKIRSRADDEPRFEDYSKYWYLRDQCNFNR